ncbi:MAG: radical SAM/SPASM domain-containing protein [Eisenbergiella sp.]
MNILNNMDKKSYLRVKRNVQFFYFGKQCMADYKQNTFSIIDKIDTDIIKNINGLNTVEEVYFKTRQIDEELTYLEYERRIKSLCSKGIVIAREAKKLCETTFWGEYGKFYPKDLLIELTNICNYKCPFCYKKAISSGTFISDEIMKEIEQLVKDKIPYVLLSGGEPTLHPHLEQYIESLSKVCTVSMNTNGSVLRKISEETISKLAHIQISLYGIGNEEYFKNTGIIDGYENVMCGIRMLNRLKVDYTVAITLNRDTINNLEHYVEVLCSEKVKNVNIGHVDLFGREAEREERSLEYKRAIEVLPNRIKKLKNKYYGKMNIKISHFDYDLTNIDADIFKDCLKCGKGVESFAISQDGMLRACECFPEDIFNIGNIEELKFIIDGKKEYRKLEKAIEKFKSQCTGGYPCEALEQYCLIHNI